MDILFKKTKLKILIWCIEDWTSLFSISSFVEEFYRYEDPELIKVTSLAIIKKLLDEDLVKAGELLLDDNIFIPWDMTTDEILAKIRVAWDSLGRELYPHEIVWFEITEKGKKEFEYLNSLPELKETNLFYFDGEIKDILNIIKPHGYLIGKKSSNNSIRLIQKRKSESLKIFNKLTENGKIIYKTDKKIISKLSDNLYVIYRPNSKLGLANIDIRARDFSRNLKLKIGDHYE
jgi:hypothetical protein